MQNLKRKTLLWILLLPLAIVGCVVGGAVLWLAIPAATMPDAAGYLESGDQVEVTQGDWLTFRPKGITPDTGLVLYSGGRVEPEAYAPLAYQIAEAGYLVVIPKLPFNMAVLDIEAAANVIDYHSDVQYWAVGGHSLGGAMAAQYANEHRDTLQGLVLWAAFPSNSVDLSQSDLHVLSVFGSFDSARDRIKNAASVMPPDTVWVEIEGGNHEQFGWYEGQVGDPDAIISRKEQQESIIKATIELLASLKE